MIRMELPRTDGRWLTRGAKCALCALLVTVAASYPFVRWSLNRNEDVRSDQQSTVRRLTPADVTNPELAEAIRGLAKHHIHVSEVRKEGAVYLSVTTEATEPVVREQIDDEAAKALSTLSNVWLIHLYATSISDVTLKRIAEAHGSTLRVLSAHTTGITDDGISALAGCQDLEELIIYNTRVTDRSLPTVGALTNLRVLYLNWTPITDEGLHHLTNLEKLEWLALIETSISDGGLEHLAGLKNLKLLMVGGTDVTDAGVERLQDALPELRVDRTVPLREE